MENLNQEEKPTSLSTGKWGRISTVVTPFVCPVFLKFGPFSLKLCKISHVCYRNKF